MPAESVRIGVDVGGTNTDVILVSDDTEHLYKTPTTEDPSESTAKGIARVTDRAGVDPGAVDRIAHGTTIATNALIEDEGAKTGMLTTDGFRDSVHIGRHKKPSSFSIQQPIPHQESPVVERRYRKRITERIYPPGEVDTPLDEEEVLAATEELVEEDIESIAVCYLHSYLNSTHEDRTKELIQSEFPDVTVSTSNEVAAQFREFERFTTTAINARLEPLVTTYLDRLTERLRDRRFDAEVTIMQSNGGLASIREVSRFPVTMLVSGPAAGVLSAEYQGDRAGYTNMIAHDMGGTSTDISVIPGRILERDARDSKVGEYPVLSPMLDIETIGSGGGSIAWFDRAKGFNLGPKSAGADPGPACYGLGNDRPTITDAHVVLDRINPEMFLGGEFEIHPDRSKEAIADRLCAVSDDPRFGTPRKAALSTLEVANRKMAQAIRRQTVRRGHDPREYVLVSFGGAGPMHAASLAEELEVPEVLVPPSPGISSARGLLTGQVKYDNLVTVSQRLEEIDAEEVSERFETLRSRGLDQLRADGFDSAEVEIERSVDCLYEGQGYELGVEFDGTDGEWRNRLRKRFERKHEAEYGHYFEEDPVEVLNLRVTVTGPLEEYEPVPIERDGPDPSDALIAEETVVFGDAEEPRELETPRYERDRLHAGAVVAGPAVIDAPDSTIVVPPAWQSEVRSNGAITLTGGD